MKKLLTPTPPDPGKALPGMFASPPTHPEPDLEDDTPDSPPRPARPLLPSQQTGVPVARLAGFAIPILAIVGGAAMWVVSPLLALGVVGGTAVAGAAGFAGHKLWARRTGRGRRAGGLLGGGRRAGSALGTLGSVGGGRRSGVRGALGRLTGRGGAAGGTRGTLASRARGAAGKAAGASKRSAGGKLMDKLMPKRAAKRAAAAGSRGTVAKAAGRGSKSPGLGRSVAGKSRGAAKGTKSAGNRATGSVAKGASGVLSRGREALSGAAKRTASGIGKAAVGGARRAAGRATKNSSRSGGGGLPRPKNKASRLLSAGIKPKRPSSSTAPNTKRRGFHLPKRTPKPNGLPGFSAVDTAALAAAMGERPKTGLARRRSARAERRRNRPATPPAKKGPAVADEGAGFYTGPPPGSTKSEPPAGKPVRETREQMRERILKERRRKAVPPAAGSDDEGAASFTGPATTKRPAPTAGSKERKAAMSDSDSLSTGYANMVDNSTPATLDRTLGEAQDAASSAARRNETKANDLRAEAAGMTSKDMANAAEGLLREAGRLDDDADKHRGWAQALGEKRASVSAPA